MLRVSSKTYYRVQYANGNGYLLEEYPTYEEALKGREDEWAREKQYKIEYRYSEESINTPSNYVIVKVMRQYVYEDSSEGSSKFISSTQIEQLVEGA